jgi:GntR family transcriptional repressor for pyruvate dehydrogenase complex
MQQMRDAASDPEKLMQADVAFHHVVVASTGNETLTSLLDGLSGRTARARIWRGVVLGDVTEATIDEHRAIHHALRARDPFLAQSAALLHVNTSESWLRTILD